MANIPKTVHYCWFGGNPLGPEEERCIASWRKFLPGYEIKLWDETNFDVRCCPYVSEAYDAKKWAFVSDYARFKILYEEGGLYFDTDVEVIRPLDDIIERGPFMGCEADGPEPGGDSRAPEGGQTVAAGLGLTANAGLGLTANAGLGLYREVLDSYERDHFLESDGTLNQTTVVRRVTDILFAHGMRDETGIQDVAGITIYPAEYFNPKDYLTGEITITDNTRTIHHFRMSWLCPESIERHETQARLLRHGVPYKAASRIAQAGTYLRHPVFALEELVVKLRRSTKKVARSE
ncbi:MAG: glycosyltransferase family 32 protein [Coriobacteriia bacterium]